MGGYIEETFEFLDRWGVMAEADYPYVAKETECRYDESKVVADVLDWGQISTDPEAIAQKIQDGPLEVAFSINNKFNYFDGLTVLGPDDTEFCGRQGHAISIVGYEPGNEEGGTEIVEILNGRYQWRWWKGCEDYEFKCAWNMCCWYEEEEQEVSTTGVFIMQNEWATTWADQGQFRVSADAAGKGWCNWQTEVYFVTPDLA